MRGFLGGVSAGALLAAGGLMMLSLSVPLPERLTAGKPVPEKETSAVDAPELNAASGTAEAPAQQDTSAAAPESEPAETAPMVPAPDTGAAPQLPNGGSQIQDAPSGSQPRDADLAAAQPTNPDAAALPDDLSALAAADTAPGQRPVVAADAAAQTPPAPQAGRAPGVEGTAAAAQRQPQQPAAPEAPGSEAAVVAATEPAPAPPPAAAGAEPVADSGSQLQAEADTAGSETGQNAADQPVADLPAAGTAPGSPSGGAVPQAPDIGAAPRATTLPVIGAAPDLPATTGAEEAEPPAAAAEEAPGAGEPRDTAGLSPQIGTPVVPLTERDKAQNLPRPAAGDTGEMPFIAHAAPFSNPEGRPLMSIVLIDDAGAVGAEALAEFPYPLSFAIDPQDPDAPEKMAARRAAGFEVLMLADLPRDAAPQDAETALEVWRRQLPEAVAILEGVGTGVQGNRPLADQVAAVAASAGYGLVTQNSGLNTVQKLALRDGVPAGVVFRDFDGAGQDPRAIRRFLDQAAFRAGQEGAVIMLGRLRPDTISALLIWGLQDRASRVALAPVSASLEANLPPK